MKNVTIIKNSHCHGHVRVDKFSEYFSLKGFGLEYICWLRSREYKKDNENYVFYGGGFGGKHLLFFYPVWMLVLFIYLLFYKEKKEHVFFVIDFDSAFPLYLASFFRRDFVYIYDIHDDFSKRYRMPVFLKRLITFLDDKVRACAFKVIHVDENRVSPKDKNHVVIYNSPKDFFINYDPPVLELKKVFCVSGLLSRQRGMESLTEFATAYPDCNFIVAGESIDEYSDKFIRLPNVEYLGVLAQNDLFRKIKNCHAIFSLYDPTVEINRLAASNKLYDCLMLGIPVVSNYGLQVSSSIESKNLGFLVNFIYDSSWGKIVECDNSTYFKIGKACRQLYQDEYNFQSNFIEKLDCIFGE